MQRARGIGRTKFLLDEATRLHVRAEAERVRERAKIAQWDGPRIRAASDLYLGTPHRTASGADCSRCGIREAGITHLVRRSTCPGPLLRRVRAYEEART